MLSQLLCLQGGTVQAWHHRNRNQKPYCSSADARQLESYLQQLGNSGGLGELVKAIPTHTLQSYSQSSLQASHS